MEGRINLKTITKSKNPEKLIVFLAESTEDEIRFYFNKEQYVVARDNNNGTFSILYEEEEPVVNRNIDIKTLITTVIEILKISLKENLKFFLINVLLISYMISAIGMLIVGLIFKTKLAAIGIMLGGLIGFIVIIVYIVIQEKQSVSIAQKSKHSAEHMMANFLEKNKRLPQNMSEIKKTSRFCDDCGSRKRIEGITKTFVIITVTLLISIFILICVEQVCKKEILLGIAFLVICIITGICVEILTNKYRKLDFIIKPIKKLLNNVIQCANTTKNVEDNDIIMAYYVAREWIKVVYPEFYNKDEDTFIESVKN